MIIIADCGATKSEWRVLHSNGTASRFIAGGINISAMSTESILRTISEIGSKISATDSSAAEIYLYIAGIADEKKKDEIRNIFKSYFPVNILDIQSDMVGAARAVCGKTPGVAAIIGTGSNSCLWDGEKIARQIYSGGFILGDEGSAATLGKHFISDFVKGLTPKEIASEFTRLFPLEYKDIISNIYRSEESPSGFLGSFSPFISKHYSHPYIQELVDNNFRLFFRRCIKQYENPSHKLGVVGGFGYALKEILTRIAAEEGIIITKILPYPTDALVEYHKESQVL